MPKPTVICVDDEMMVLSTLVEELQYILGKGFDFEIAQSGDEALDLIQELLEAGISIPLLFTDCCMSGKGGIELVPQVKVLTPHTLCVLLTGMEQCDLDISIHIKDQILGYVPKPWSEKCLRSIMQEAQLLDNPLVSVRK